MGLDVVAVFLPLRMKNCVTTVLGDVPIVPPDVPARLRGILSLEEPELLTGTARRAILRRLFRVQIGEVIEETKPDIVHAHSAWMSAAQGFAAARAAGLPFLYEIRGLWEETNVAEKINRKYGVRYWYFRWHENYLIRRADAIITLSNGLRDEMIARGSDVDRLSIVPNGVDTEAFAPTARDSKLADSLGCGDRTVVGYISSLRRMEGVKYLVEAMQKVSGQACAVVVGDGPEKASLERMARDLHVDHNIRFVGAVPHAEIRNYYSIIDVFVVPRMKMKVCEIVTPLKPLEAMAMGKCLLMSDVNGLRELAKTDEAAVFFEPENSDALAAKLNALIVDKEMRTAMGENARRYVVEQRDWRKLVERYIPAYEKVIGQART